MAAAAAATSSQSEAQSPARRASVRRGSTSNAPPPAPAATAAAPAAGAAGAGNGGGSSSNGLPAGFAGLKPAGAPVAGAAERLVEWNEWPGHRGVLPAHVFRLPSGRGRTNKPAASSATASSHSSGARAAARGAAPHLAAGAGGRDSPAHLPKTSFGPAALTASLNASVPLSSSNDPTLGRGTPVRLEVVEGVLDTRELTDKAQASLLESATCRRLQRRALAQPGQQSHGSHVLLLAGAKKGGGAHSGGGSSGAGGGSSGASFVRGGGDGPGTPNTRAIARRASSALEAAGLPALPALT